MNVYALTAGNIANLVISHQRSLHSVLSASMFRVTTLAYHLALIPESTSV
jgi:hypothetical protein